MTSQSIPEEAQALNAFDDKSFIKKKHSYPVGPNESTRAPVFPADTTRGHSFEPFHIEARDLHINQLPHTPLQLFQLFLPIWLVEKWIHYSNSWVASLIAKGVTDSWNDELKPKSRVWSWGQGITVADVYIWFGMLIYVGIHKERRFESHWSTPKLGKQGALHSILKFMPLSKFQLIHRYLRPFDHTKIDETAPLPKVFQAAEEWSDLIQQVSLQLFQPGTYLAVDECMIRYTGKSEETATLKNKPVKLGFKIWVVAQKGFFLRWLWHLKNARYGAVGIEPAKTRASRGRGKKQEEGSDVIPLNSTQSVVVALCNLLPKQTYHVVVDNLFSSADLFRSLRTHGHGATGTARPNCGIHKELKADKKRDKDSGKSGYEYNEVKVITTADNQVGSYDKILCKSLTNLSSSSLYRSTKSRGRTTPSCYS